MKIINQEEWHKIGDTLTNYFGICSCQRKLKSIILNLYEIKQKCIKAYEGGDRNFTGAEWLLLALLERMPNKEKIPPVIHGVNCEYPIINEYHEFWIWIDQVKDDPNLEDN